MKQFKQEFTLKQVALMLGVHRDTIMYWEENHLIPPARRNPRNNYRVYNLEEVMEIARIRGIDTVDIDAVNRHRKKQRNRKKNANL